MKLGAQLDQIVRSQHRISIDNCIFTSSFCLMSLILPKFHILYQL